MATLPVRSFTLLIACAVIACPAFAAKPGKEKGDTKKAGEIAIHALEQQIHEQKEQEKAARKALDERYEHVIKSMDPKEIHGQLEEILVVLRQVRADLGTADDLNFGGNRVHAREATEKAEHQVEKAFATTPGRRGRLPPATSVPCMSIWSRAWLFQRSIPWPARGRTSWPAAPLPISGSWTRSRESVWPTTSSWPLTMRSRITRKRRRCCTRSTKRRGKR